MGFVREPAVHGFLVGLGVDRDAPYPELAAGEDDAHGYLAAVRDQDLPRSSRIPPARLALLQEGPQALLSFLARSELRCKAWS